MRFATAEEVAVFVVAIGGEVAVGVGDGGD
jgi:hypothetical protein